MTSMLAIALFQPDIPQNTGTILRTAACLGLTVHIIEPAGFAINDGALRRAGLDYLPAASLERHVNWEAFLAWRTREGRRLVLATTRAKPIHTDFAFQGDDVLLFGRESSGAPAFVHDAAEARIAVPMMPGMRSLNLAVSVAIIAGEALRQTNAFPRWPEPS